MDVEFDSTKRSEVLSSRGLDIAEAGKVFDGFHLTRRDDKHSFEEERFHSIGMLGNDVVIITWTPRNSLRRIVTMWKANERERTKFYEQRDRCG